MKRFVFLAAAALVSLSATPAQSSDGDWGYVEKVFGTSNGAVMFYTTGNRSAPPACQYHPQSKRFLIEGNTVAGQAAVTVLMTAYAMHKRIYIVGTGACSPLWTDTERVNFFYTEN